MKQHRLYKGYPIGRKRIAGTRLEMKEIDPRKLIECSNCKSETLDDLAFSRQHGYFQDICVAIVRCKDCGNIDALLWAEDKEGL